MYSGQWALTAKAIDNSGAVTTSNAVDVAVSSLEQTSGGNSDGALKRSHRANNLHDDRHCVRLDGSIARVEFWQGPNKLGESSKAPYTWTLYGAVPGTYTRQWALTAKAIDNSGAVTTFNAVNVTVKARR